MIDSYKFGEIIIDGKIYTSDVIIYPDHVQSSWWREKGHEVSTKDLKEALEARPEVLIIGTGASGLVNIFPEVEKKLREKSIELVSRPTEEACRLYNEISKKKRVVAALHLTC